MKCHTRYIDMLITKRTFLVMDKNMGLCLYMEKWSLVVCVEGFITSKLISCVYSLRKGSGLTWHFLSRKLKYHVICLTDIRSEKFNLVGWKFFLCKWHLLVAFIVIYLKFKCGFNRTLSKETYKCHHPANFIIRLL